MERRTGTGRQRTRDAWRRLVTGYAGSGLTVAGYCAREGICTASLYRWRALLGTADRDSERRGVPVAAASEAAFVDLGTLATAGSRVELRVDLGRGVILQLSCG